MGCMNHKKEDTEIMEMERVIYHSLVLFMAVESSCLLLDIEVAGGAAP